MLGQVDDRLQDGFILRDRFQLIVVERIDTGDTSQGRHA